MLAEYWLNGTNDPGRSADLDRVTHLKRLWLSELSGRKRLIAGAEFIAVAALLVQVRPPYRRGLGSSRLPAQESQHAVVEIRALRGNQRSSVYRECVISDDLFRRLLAAGATRRFRSLNALEPYGPHKLDKQRARRFAREVAELQDSLREPEVAAIIEVTLWCAHATHKSWLIISPKADNTSSSEE